MNRVFDFIYKKKDVTTLLYVKTFKKNCAPFIIKNLDDLPFPDHSLFLNQKYIVLK